jgi:hypothetical protein
MLKARQSLPEDANLVALHLLTAEFLLSYEKLLVSR